MHAASTSLLRRSHSARMEPWDVQAPRSPLAAVRRVIDSGPAPYDHLAPVHRPSSRQSLRAFHVWPWLSCSASAAAFDALVAISILRDSSRKEAQCYPEDGNCTL